VCCGSSNDGSSSSSGSSSSTAAAPVGQGCRMRVLQRRQGGVGLGLGQLHCQLAMQQVGLWLWL
jgi:hypothetical protein